MALPIPDVYAWSSEPNNPVGAEYILMERIQGVPLANRWGQMNNLERYKIIDQIVDVEKKLVGLKFPVYGRLYLRDSMLLDGTRQHALPADLDPDGLFCIGPSCSRSVWNRRSADAHMPDAGPCESAVSLLSAIDDSLKGCTCWNLQNLCPVVHCVSSHIPELMSRRNSLVSMTISPSTSM